MAISEDAHTAGVTNGVPSVCLDYALVMVHCAPIGSHRRGIPESTPLHSRLCTRTGGSDGGTSNVISNVGTRPTETQGSRVAGRVRAVAVCGHDELRHANRRELYTFPSQQDSFPTRCVHCRTSNALFVEVSGHRGELQSPKGGTGSSCRSGRRTGPASRTCPIWYG